MLPEAVNFSMNAPVINRIAPLTSLRFFAAFAIVVLHSGYYFGFIHDFNSAIHVELRQGVTFFFVLSGFILTVVYSGDDFRQPRAFLEFMRKRVARLWPLHITTLVINAILVPTSSIINSWSAFGILCLNILMLQSIVPLKEVYLSFNIVSWSISTEFYFYLSLPLLLLLAHRKIWLPLVAVLPVACAVCTAGNLMNLPVGYPNNPGGMSHLALVYINPLVRIFDFAVGVVSAHIFLRTAHRWELTTRQATLLESFSIILCVAILFVSPEIADALGRFPFVGDGGKFWLNSSGFSLIGFSFLIFMFAMQRGLISKLLSAPHWVLLGDISYATYLCHMAILMFYSNVLPGHKSFLDWVICLAIIMLLSHLLYTFVERPCRKLILANQVPRIKLDFLTSLGAQLSSGSLASFRNGGKMTAKTAVLAVECLCLIGLFVFITGRQNVISASDASKIIASQTAYREKFVVERAGLTCDGIVVNFKKERVILFLRASQSANFNQVLNLELIDSSSRKLGATSQRIGFMKAVGPGEVLVCPIKVTGLSSASKLALRVVNASTSRGLDISRANSDSSGTHVVIPLKQMLSERKKDLAL